MKNPAYFLRLRLARFAAFEGLPTLRGLPTFLRLVLRLAMIKRL